MYQRSQATAMVVAARLRVLWQVDGPRTQRLKAAVRQSSMRIDVSSSNMSRRSYTPQKEALTAENRKPGTFN